MRLFFAINNQLWQFNWRATHLPPLEERIAEGNRVKEGAARFMSMVNINCDF